MTMLPVYCNQRLRCHIRPIHPVQSQNSLHMSCMLHTESMDICSIIGACVGLVYTTAGPSHGGWACDQLGTGWKSFMRYIHT